MTVTATATDTTVGLRYCAMVGVGVTMQGGVRHGRSIILYPTPGRSRCSYNRRLVTPNYRCFGRYTAIKLIKSQKG